MRKLSNQELKRLSSEEYKNATKNPVTLLLDDVRSAYNVGAAFRTADAFLAEKICLCGISPLPRHKDIRKTALGAEQNVEWRYYAKAIQAIEDYKSRNYTIIGVEQVQGSFSLDQFQVVSDKKYLLIFGNEIKGVDQKLIKLCDQCIEIRQFGTKHSLNISVSIGIVLWHFLSRSL
ncbi:TrmH family RNA methyltransferase [Bacteroidetes bacterium endosymbiont of Geopemphigus sp.]|uniref:TrmH family RNA methyltransferase n=1 Tax=Bacteroidetes bacterium endosymbiont of Geopemphigus sp. TaxID=2047937 RepID=UPI000CD0974C|nr:TrmH family RNA methyltransferase [Bacteroidetes bacterium endosymbiont of Geopemphigus sp.]